MRKGAESLVWWEEVLDALLNMVLELRTEGFALGYDGFTRYCDMLSPVLRPQRISRPL